MKVLVIYDSYFGNTERIAKEIGNAFDNTDEVLVKKVDEVDRTEIDRTEILIVGSPTRAFRASPNINSFLGKFGSNDLSGIKVAAFDTRFNVEETKSKFLRMMVRLFGYAAEPMAKKLVKKGGELIIKPEGFYVSGTEGPLVDNEIERAIDWIKQIRE